MYSFWMIGTFTRYISQFPRESGPFMPCPVAAHVCCSVMNGGLARSCVAYYTLCAHKSPAVPLQAAAEPILCLPSTCTKQPKHKEKKEGGRQKKRRGTKVRTDTGGKRTHNISRLPNWLLISVLDHLPGIIACIVQWCPFIMSMCLVSASCFVCSSEGERTANLKTGKETEEPCEIITVGMDNNSCYFPLLILLHTSYGEYNVDQNSHGLPVKTSAWNTGRN